MARPRNYAFLLVRDATLESLYWSNTGLLISKKTNYRSTTCIQPSHLVSYIAQQTDKAGENARAQHQKGKKKKKKIRNKTS